MRGVAPPVVQHGHMLALWMAAVLVFLALTRAWILRGDGGWVRLNRERRNDTSRWRQLNGLRRADFYFVTVFVALAFLCLLIALGLALG